jgi:hypothetical protein
VVSTDCAALRTWPKKLGFPLSAQAGDMVAKMHQNFPITETVLVELLRSGNIVEGSRFALIC